MSLPGVIAIICAFVTAFVVARVFRTIGNLASLIIRLPGGGSSLFDVTVGGASIGYLLVYCWAMAHHLSTTAHAENQGLITILMCALLVLPLLAIGMFFKAALPKKLLLVVSLVIGAAIGVDLLSI